MASYPIAPLVGGHRQGDIEPRRQPSFGASFGAGLGEALGNLLENKLKEHQVKTNQMKLSKTLQSIGYPENIADAVSTTHPSILKAARDQMYGGDKGENSEVSNVVKARRAIFPRVQSGEMSVEKATQFLQNSGISEELIPFVISTKLDDAMVDKLTKWSGGDPKKAQKIALKMGFRG